MKRSPNNYFVARHLFSLALAAGVAFAQPALAATVALATSPLATSTTSTVKPNLLFVLDNSGSMSWDHMPDDATDGGSAVSFSYGYYGLRSSQCNQVYFDPADTYQPPVYADGSNYTNSSFTSAWVDGYNTGSGTLNLNSGFKASLSMNADSTAGAAYYYSYSGTQTAPQQKNYNSTTNTFYNECHSAQYAAPGRDVFTKISLSSTAAATTATLVISGSTSTSVSSIKINGVELLNTATAATTSNTALAADIAAKITMNGYSASAVSGTVTITGLAATASSLIVTQSGTMTIDRTIYPIANATTLQSFANWYSYYRTRMLMMKTAAGRAFSSLNNGYRVGLMKISSTGTPTLGVGTFESTHRSNWYTALYGTTESGSTPLRTALSAAGRYYAGKLSGTDPIQYSCQQNFTILSTDGYWNTGDGFKVDGTTPVGNQDGTAERPMYDGAQATTIYTFTYTRDFYSKVTSGCSSGKKLKTQPQIGTCTKTVSTGSCTPTNWINNGSATIGSTCNSTAAPNPTTPVLVGTPVGTAGSSGGTSDNLADIAMYYYQTDLRTPTLSNCTGVPVSPATTGNTLCSTPANPLDPDPYNNVFRSGSDNNLQQHMTTFTLGLGASGWMDYSPSYLTDTTGDYPAVKLGTSAKLGASTITVSGSGSTSVSSITVNGVQLMSGTSVADTNVSTVAANIAAKISLNGFSAISTGSTITITGPASAAGFAPVITKSGTMTFNAFASPVCGWQADGTSCNWPFPGMSGSDGLIANVDDLWHAAVNGRGAYFSATSPASLSAGLSNALAGINARKGSAAAAATSTLNPVAGNNFAYVASYTTVSWKGNLEARGINVDTGVVNENASWCVENVVSGACAAPGAVTAEIAGATTSYYCVTPNSVTCAGGTLVGTDCKVPVATACVGTMNTMVSDTADTRTIYTANSAGTALIPFNAAYAAANPGYFSAAHISTLSQWTALTAAQKTAAEGVNLLNYLRGQHGYEDRTANLVDNRLYRAREAVLGDALESQPSYIGAAVFSYPYTGYSAYVTAQASRSGTVYMGANDGMMHAIAADTGIERWAYVPSMVVTNMWKLADKSYATLHANFVNGSPTTSDIYCPGNCGGVTDVTYGDSASWRTILVAGLNGGGRGYYALDITVPTAPALLWEFTPTTGIGKYKDDDVGYGFGHPIITRKADGTWVVVLASGYNNVSPGTGKGYLFVLNASTGAVISKIDTGVGNTTTPSGLAKVSGWNNEPTGNTVGYIYGGDLLGNVWRFDINSAVAAVTGTGSVMKLASLYSDAAATLPQPVTTAPVLGVISGKRIIFIGTGKYLEIGDLTTTQVQTQYAIKDDDATTTLVNPRTTLVNQTLTNNPDGTATRVSSGNAVNFFMGRGWYVDFPDSGERTNIDSKLVQGTLLVPTIVPSNTACSPGGYGWLNYFDYKTGGAVNTVNHLSSSKYDAPIVGVNVIYVQGLPKVGVVTSTNPTPVLDESVAFSATAAGFSGKRVLWRELIQ